MSQDEYFLQKALRLAERGKGWTSPNPMVGALVLKEGRIIGKGYHPMFGGSHAEINAIEDAGQEAEGATLYVTLEPCCHYGKTPPCVERIIASGIKRVVIGTIDPNPIVNGRGVEILKQKGIEVRVGVLEQECRRLNRAYFKFITTGLPLVTLKFAQSLDGNIAIKNGQSKWISNERSRKIAHQLRKEHDAVLVGIGTILKDDPQLTVRYIRGRNPYRVILDSRLRIPLGSKVVTDEFVDKTILVTTPKAPDKKIKLLQDRGVRVWVLDPDQRGGVNLHSLLPKLGQMGVTSLLVEGGNEVLTAMMKANLADRVVIFIAPILLGEGIPALGDLGIKRIDEAVRLRNIQLKKIKSDLMVVADIRGDNVYRSN